MVSEKDRLVNKSIEAFILGLEIYNKPTIRYRVEGFSFFVVNAWELMLKAEMLNRGLSIFYRDNPDRTVTVEVAIRTIYTDKNTRIRLNSDQFAIKIRQNLYITKSKDEADFVVSIEKGSENRVEIVKELKDPSNTHKYSFQSVLTVVAEKMKKENIRIDYEKGFNSYVLNLIIDFYDVKREQRFAYKHTIGKQEQFTYSQQFIEFILGEMKKNPDTFVESLRKSKR